jgi:transposase
MITPVENGNTRCAETPRRCASASQVLRARNHVEKSFGLEKMCSQTLEIYARLIEHSGRW